MAPNRGLDRGGDRRNAVVRVRLPGQLPAEVLLDAEPDGSVAFSIWTEEQVRLWALGKEFEPVGRGTENDLQPGDLFWSGRLGRPGRFYVVAQQKVWAGPVDSESRAQVVTTQDYVGLAHQQDEHLDTAGMGTAIDSGIPLV